MPCSVEALSDVFEPGFWATVVKTPASMKMLVHDDVIRLRAEDRSFDCEFVVIGLRPDHSPVLKVWPYEISASLKTHPAKSARSQALEVLGLPENATDAEIKAAGTVLIKTHHPDHCKDETDRIRRTMRMQDINNALDLLLKPKAA